MDVYVGELAAVLSFGAAVVAAIVFGVCLVLTSWAVSTARRWNAAKRARSSQAGADIRLRTAEPSAQRR